MASLVPGFEYDIFISYRQKDNKYDGWVTEFVSNLKKELEATFKDDISVYFDINPHDGLLETHDVDASLKEKLRCLVFIPIISRTYCDPKSFAWEHEFKAFVEQASRDQFGLKVKLSNGNVANRILPIQIHDLDVEDKVLLGSQLGGVLRAIEFIYKEPGVNKPLTSEDDEKKNLNNTKYRIQINKVANAIKEIISSLKAEKDSKVKRQDKVPLEEVQIETGEREYIRKGIINKISKKWLILTFALLLSIVGGFGIYKILIRGKEARDEAKLDKSIAVLPFVNMSNDPEQEYFSDGMMQEILNHLFMIGGLKIPSSTSSMRFKGSKLSVRDIARELGVSYVLEGNVSRSGNNIRIIVRLINGKNEQLIWERKDTITKSAPNIFEIQSSVAQQVAENLKVAITPDVKKRIEYRPTENTEAYTLYLQADLLKPDQAESLLNKAIELDPGFADAYAVLADLWLYRGGHGGVIGRDEVIANVAPLLEKALQLNQNSLGTHSVLATFRLYYYWDFDAVDNEYQVCTKLAPSNSYLLGGFSDYLLASGKFSDAYNLVLKNFENDRNSVYNWANLGVVLYYNGQQGKALETMETTRRLFPDNDFVFTNSIRLFTYTGKFDQAIKLFEKYMPHKNSKDLIPYHLGHLGIAYYKSGNISKSETFLKELHFKSEISPVGSPSFFLAAIYTAMGENEKAIQSLEKAYTDHELEMYWLKVEPLFQPLHRDPRFENLLLKIGFK